MWKICDIKSESGVIMLSVRPSVCDAVHCG